MTPSQSQFTIRRAKTEAQGRCPKGTAYRRFLTMLAEVQSGCLLWPYGKSRSGYGAIYSAGNEFPVHTLSWELANEERVPAGLFVCHTCDVRHCFNPAHLFLGTPQHNMDDKMRKGRQASGQRHGMARLAESEVRTIRAIGRLQTFTETAAQFNVSRHLVRKIVKGELWKHVQ